MSVFPLLGLASRRQIPSDGDVPGISPLAPVREQGVGEINLELGQ